MDTPFRFVLDQCRKMAGTLGCSLEEAADVLDKCVSVSKPKDEIEVAKVLHGLIAQGPKGKQ